MLADYIEGYNCPASFKIRYLTSKKLSEFGHEVTYIYPSFSGRKIVKKETKNLTLVATPGIFSKRLRKGGFSFLDIITKIKYVIAEDYDVIHVSCGHRPAQLIPALVGKYYNRSIIVDEWWEWYGGNGIAKYRKGFIGKFIGLYDTIFEIFTKKFYHGVIPITNVLKQRIKKHSYVEVMHGGAEDSALIEYDINSARSELNLPKDYFIIGLSNFDEEDYKDNAKFLNAFAKLSKQYDNLRLFLTGEEEYINYFLSKSGFADKIIYSGWVEFEKYNKYLSACNLFVLPLTKSKRNSGRWPNKLGDYLCVNRPIISNHCGDLEEFFGIHKIGYLCDSTEDGYYKMLKTVTDKKVDCSNYAFNSRKVAEEILSFEKRCCSIIKFYQKLISVNRNSKNVRRRRLNKNPTDIENF